MQTDARELCEEEGIVPVPQGLDAMKASLRAHFGIRGGAGLPAISMPLRASSADDPRSNATFSFERFLVRPAMVAPFGKPGRQQQHLGLSEGRYAVRRAHRDIGRASSSKTRACAGKPKTRL